MLKLKAARDVNYLKRSIPDLVQFRIAYLLIKTWAKDRGVYSSKFGYLGGVHLSVMLVRICKMLLHNGAVVSIPDLVITFFNHYAHFDWKRYMVFDPLFHKKLRYTRTFKEPICLLGWHPPALNTAAAASVPTVKTITAELQRADRMLAQPELTWSEFFKSPETQLQGSSLTGAAAEFLRAYKSYVKIDIHYWGPSLEKASMLIGRLESRCVAVLVGMWKAEMLGEGI